MTVYFGKFPLRGLLDFQYLFASNFGHDIHVVKFSHVLRHKQERDFALAVQPTDGYCIAPVASRYDFNTRPQAVRLCNRTCGHN